MEEVGKYAQPEAQMLIEDLRQIVKQARSHVAATANYELTMMYWHIGERINRDLLGNQRAEYGKQIVTQVATHYEINFRGCKGTKNPLKMAIFKQNRLKNHKICAFFSSS